MKNKNNEFNPYKNDKLSLIPTWIKVLFLKYWVAAAALFFFGIGNPLIQTPGKNFGADEALRSYLSLSLGFALFDEYIVKSFIKLMDDGSHDIYKLNLINKKGVVSFLLNLLYGFVVMIPMITILVFLAKHNLNLDFINPRDSKAAIEPFTGGFVFLVIDLICVYVKDLINNLIKKNNYKKQADKELELEKEILALTDEEYLNKCKENN